MKIVYINQRGRFEEIECKSITFSATTVCIDNETFIEIAQIINIHE